MRKRQEDLDARSEHPVQEQDIVSLHDSRLLFVVLKVHPDGWFEATANTHDDMCVHRKVDSDEAFDIVGRLTEAQFKRLEYDTFIR